MRVNVASRPFIGDFNRMFQRMFGVGVKEFNWVDVPDLMIFTGGEDISPELYGQENYASYNNVSRDRVEIEVYNFCLEENIPMFGVCRGHQFLNVMLGGELIQHIEPPHPGNHMITGKHNVFVNSMHHQGVTKSNLETLGVYNDIIEVSSGENIFTVQFHPEFMDGELDEYIKENLLRYLCILSE